MERLLNDAQKIVLLLLLRIFGHDGKIGLPNAVLVIAVHVLPDSGVQKGLLERRALGRAEGVIQDGKGDIFLPVQDVSGRDVAGQIRVVIQRFAVRHGILPAHFHRLLKRPLQPDRRIHFDFIEMGEIRFIQPGQPLRHVHVAVQIDIAVGRMVVLPVKIQKFLIGQLRNDVGVAAGLHPIGGVRIERGGNFPLQHVVRR